MKTILDTINSINSTSQTEKNIAWFLPRPKPDRYKGGMPLYCEEWLVALAHQILGTFDIKLLNLFCGMNKLGVRFDIKDEVKPHILGDAHNLSSLVDGKFDVILADPPYSNDEAKKLYGTPPLKYKIWTSECEKVLKDGGLLIVYHKNVMPNPNTDTFKVVKRVFIGNRVNHTPRVAVYFQKARIV